MGVSSVNVCGCVRACVLSCVRACASVPARPEQRRHLREFRPLAMPAPTSVIARGARRAFPSLHDDDEVYVCVCVRVCARADSVCART